MTMELSMTIAIVAAAAIGEFFTALIITLFVLVAEVLEGMTVSRGRHAIHDLVDFLPICAAAGERSRGCGYKERGGGLKPGQALVLLPATPGETEESPAEYLAPLRSALFDNNQRHVKVVVCESDYRALKIGIEHIYRRCSSICSFGSLIVAPLEPLESRVCGFTAMHALP
jgi:hypothetical protein